MTNMIKTVQNPRLILLDCRNSHKLAEIISDVLNFCSFNTCIDDFTQVTDFIIENADSGTYCPENVIADTVLFDENSKMTRDKISTFREGVTSYENAMSFFGNDGEGIMTYSSDNYGADVASRKYTENGGTVSFELVGGGILSRVNIINGKYTVDEILACTGVLLAAGMPLASVLSFFEYEEGC